MPLPRSKNWVSGLRPTTEIGSNPKDELGMLKAPLALLSEPAGILQAFCMQDGLEKYGPYNYRVAKVQALIYLEACKRHISALLEGEDFDPKTGKPHIGYALATLQIYADAWINGCLIDNRPLPGKGPQLLALLERTPGQAELTPQEIQEGIMRIVRLSQPQLTLPTEISMKADKDTVRIPTRKVKKQLKGSKKTTRSTKKLAAGKRR
jgi:hypothetical protein